MLPTHALSLRHPWLWYVLETTHPSPKLLENRTRRILNWKEWNPKGEVWLHASKDDDAAYWAAAIEKVREVFGHQYPTPRWADCARGGIIGRARIAGMITPAGEVQWEPDANGGGRPPLDMRWHFRGQHAYILQSIRKVPFTPARGMLGFWSVPPTVLDHLQAQGER